MLTHGVRLCLHPRALVGSACDGHASLLAHPGGMSRFVGTDRVPEGIARASRKAISLRHSSARSVVTGSQRNWSCLELIRWHPGCWQRFEIPGRWLLSVPRRYSVAGDDEDQTAERLCHRDAETRPTLSPSDPARPGLKDSLMENDFEPLRCLRLMPDRVFLSDEKEKP